MRQRWADFAAARECLDSLNIVGVVGVAVVRDFVAITCVSASMTLMNCFPPPRFGFSAVQCPEMKIDRKIPPGSPLLVARASPVNSTLAMEEILEEENEK